MFINTYTQTAYVGDVKRYECSVRDGIPKPLLFWKTDKGYRVPNSYVQETEDGKVILVFKKVTAKLARNYTCVGINAAGKTEESVQLKVKGELE